MTDDLLDTLTALDPARDMRPHDSEATLRAILSSPATPARPRRRVPLLLVAAASVTAAAAVAVPLATGGKDATAGWTAMPQTLDAAARTETAAACRDAVAQATPAPHLQRAVLAERRGDWGLVQLAQGDRTTVCLIDLVRRSDGGKGWAMGIDGPAVLPAPAVDSVVTTAASGTSRELDDVIQRTMAGRVGAQVRKVVVSTTTRGDVTATVVDGWFAAWWPGEQGGTPQAVAPDGLIPEGWTHLNVTLADGTTRRLAYADVVRH